MIGILQIVGAAAAVTLFVIAYVVTRSPWALAAGGAMTLHFVADALAKFFCFGGLMSFNIDNYVKLQAWLQLLGLALVFMGCSFWGHWFTHTLCFVGAGVSLFGFNYKKVYQ